MTNLLTRGTFPDAAEEVILIDGPEPYLPGSGDLIRQIRHKGFAVRHVQAAEISAESGLRGVPLLIVTRPGNDVAYIGGHGASKDADGRVYTNLRQGHQQPPLPLLGCAVGAALRRAVDPFRLKYSGK